MPPPEAATLLDNPALGGPGPLLAAIEAHADHLARTTRALDLGGRRIAAADYAAALRRFTARAHGAASPEALRDAALAEFDLVEAKLDKPFLVSGYYEPQIPGARRPTARFTQPLYLPPPELRRGVPYLTRAEIDTGAALAGRDLVLCYVDPLDAFVLQTEGGGTIALDDGALLPLDHAGTNNRPHVRIGQFFEKELPPAERNWPGMEAYLRRLPERQMRDILERDPRYSFYRPRARPVGPSTAIGLPATAERTIATDGTIMPRGALGFLVTEVPQPDSGGPGEVRWRESARFVLDEDAGGAIRGARVDLYFGSGASAGRAAGVMKRPGRLFYLVPRMP